MKLYIITAVGIAMIGSLICASVYAQEPAVRPADIDIAFELEHHPEGKRGGSVSHERNTKDLAAHPLVHTLTGLDGRSHVVSISYVGYASFQIAKRKDAQLKPGHVFAVQVFSGKKGVTIETAETNVTKLIGKPEPLRHALSGYWSRRITDEHRLVYRVENRTVLIAQVRYHY